MLTPVRWDLKLYPGFKFDPLFIFYDDAAHAVTHDLTGYAAQLVIGNGLLVLTSSGSGLTLGGAGGTVQALATAVQTAGIPNGRLPWLLEWTPAGGEPDCPVAGTVTVAPPTS